MSCFGRSRGPVVTPAQRKYEPFLEELARAFPGVFCCLLATRQGEVLARLPRETQHPKNPEFDETEFDDIPVARWRRAPSSPLYWKFPRSRSASSTTR